MCCKFIQDWCPTHLREYFAKDLQIIIESELVSDLTRFQNVKHDIVHIDSAASRVWTLALSWENFYEDRTPNFYEASAGVWEEERGNPRLAFSPGPDAGGHRRTQRRHGWIRETGSRIIDSG